MPLGSESTLGLAGPNGTPEIAELPAPADPAGGTSWANVCDGKITDSATKRTSVELRGINVTPKGHGSNHHVGSVFPRAKVWIFFLSVVLRE